MIKVSVIIPAYNAEENLRKCIDSVVNQTLTQIEIIIVNDGSTDNTQNIIKDFKSKDVRVISIDQANTGPDGARNTGLKIAQGDYIGFVDSDDTIHAKMFEEMYKKSQELKSDIVSCNYTEEYSDGEKSNKMYNISRDTLELSVYGLDNFIRNDIVAYRFGGEVWSKLIKREIIHQNSIVFKSHKNILGEDMLFLLECILYSENVSYLDEVLYYHKIREGSLTHSEIPDMIFRLFGLIETYKRIAEENKKYDSLKSGLALLTYSYITNSLFFEQGFKKKYVLLMEIEKKTIFRETLILLLKDKNSSNSVKLFSFLGINGHFKLMSTFRQIIDYKNSINRRTFLN